MFSHRFGFTEKSVYCSKRLWPHFTPQKNFSVSGTHLLEADWTPGPSVDVRVR
jgi:hypothetical protein